MIPNSHLKERSPIHKVLTIAGVTQHVLANAKRGEKGFTADTFYQLLLRLLEALTTAFAAIPFTYTVTSNTAGSTLDIPVEAEHLLTHIVVIKTDATASPTWTIAIDGGDTLINNEDWDETDSSVWIAGYARAAATTLKLTTNCDCTVKYYYES